METERKSQLKVWEVRHVRRGKRQLLGIVCPNCSSRALVSKGWWTNELTSYKTRACTYCFRASWLPGEHPNKKEQDD